MWCENLPQQWKIAAGGPRVERKRGERKKRERERKRKEQRGKKKGNGDREEKEEKNGNEKWGGRPPGGLRGSRGVNPHPNPPVPTYVIVVVKF